MITISLIQVTNRQINVIDCPPIKESSTESTHSSSVHTSEDQSLVTARSTLATETGDSETIDEDPSARGGPVNVRAMNYHHSPIQEQNVGRVREIGAAVESSSLYRDEAELHAGIQPKSNPKNSNLRRRGGALLQSQRGLESSHMKPPTRSWLQEEGVLSPGSSISTVPAMPTPRNLNLDNSGSDSDSETVQADDESSSRYYYHATAPPLSPATGYRNALTVSNSKRYGYEANQATQSTVNSENESPNRSKWGVHHIFHYNKSETSLRPDSKKRY